mmetsp:Transcript_55301/g.134320  ORF Transcript_55301/g.134320 Transcript_55301/m.134320 type:complete len:172 (+) Transcript_55301:374-889(+)
MTMTVKVVSAVVRIKEVLWTTTTTTVRTFGFVFRWIQQLDPAMVGLFPIFVHSSYHYHHHIEDNSKTWGYTLHELRTTGCHQIRGQTAVVTGANSGIGYEIAKELANCGVDVTLVCRSATKCEAAVEQIRKDIAEISSLTTTTTEDNTTEDTPPPPSTSSPSLTTMIMDMS